jgi:hypothetical protein
VMRLGCLLPSGASAPPRVSFINCPALWLGVGSIYRFAIFRPVTFLVPVRNARHVRGQLCSWGARSTAQEVNVH